MAWKGDWAASQQGPPLRSEAGEPAEDTPGLRLAQCQLEPTAQLLHRQLTLARTCYFPILERTWGGGVQPPMPFRP